MAQAAWAHRAGAQQCPALGHLLPSLFGLAPCGVYHARCITVAAVRSYRTISPLPQQGTCRPGEPVRSSRRPSSVSKDGQGVAEAVSFLWHWPSASLETHIPDVIRHTALRSSDFPPPSRSTLARKAPGSDRPVLLPILSLPHFRFLSNVYLHCVQSPSLSS